MSRSTAERETLRLAAWIPRSEVNGPGLRAVVWVQGCTRGCPGCCNPRFADPGLGEDVAVDDLAAAIGSVPGIEGVTFSGGEPFDQALALASLAERLRDSFGLGVVSYSGYTLDELRLSQDEEVCALLKATDLLIDGPYVEALSTPGSWRGSSNQNLVPLSDRYRDVLPASVDCGHGVELTLTGSRCVATGDLGHSPLQRIVALMDSEYGVRL